MGDRRGEAPLLVRVSSQRPSLAELVPNPDLGQSCGLTGKQHLGPRAWACGLIEKQHLRPRAWACGLIGKQQ